MSRQKQRINGRRDEEGNKNGFQITFRTDRRASAEWSSLRGLCDSFGKRERSPKLFAEVVLPAMRAYVEGYAEKARAARVEKRAQGAKQKEAKRK